jgi:hypothetical protein
MHYALGLQHIFSARPPFEMEHSLHCTKRQFAQTIARKADGCASRTPETSKLDIIGDHDRNVFRDSQAGPAAGSGSSQWRLDRCYIKWLLRNQFG